MYKELVQDSEVNSIFYKKNDKRVLKVQNYLKKKYNRKLSKKYIYKSHSKVANRRLRIAGRFVTRQQAFKILRLGPEELLDNLMI